MEMQRNEGVGSWSSASASARRTVGSFTSYAEAQRAVDFLSDRLFPVERTAIVAEGLKLVEQVTGRLTYGRAALNGALSGAFIGGFFGFLFGLMSWITPVVSALELAFYGIIYGALVGAALSALFHAFTGGKRDFTSVGAIAAERYNLVVDAEVADEAIQQLAMLANGRGKALPSSTSPQPA